jgi:hypothetical protein
LRRLRPAAQAERRLEECAKLGVAIALAPDGTRGRTVAPRVIGAETLREALRAGLEPVRTAASADDDEAASPSPVDRDVHPENAANFG